MFFKWKKKNRIDTNEVVKDFALSIRDRVMSKVNVHISDMKEVIRASIAQVIMEDLSAERLSGIDASPDGQRKLNELKRQLNTKLENIVVQQSVAVMDRISKMDVGPKTTKKATKTKK